MKKPLSSNSFHCNSQRFPLAAVLVLIAIVSSSCMVVKVVDVAASTAIGVTKVAVKTTGAVVGAVIPDGDDEETEPDDD